MIESPSGASSNMKVKTRADGGSPGAGLGQALSAHTGLNARCPLLIRPPPRAVIETNPREIPERVSDGPLGIQHGRRG
uniref:Uncharacterized protein n=1 Tax=Knipowitschia caucasica TaxID=637954 RepID=A0AAV2L8G0_KNICA